MNDRPRETAPTTIVVAVLLPLLALVALAADAGIPWSAEGDGSPGDLTRGAGTYLAISTFLAAAAASVFVLLRRWRRRRRDASKTEEPEDEAAATGPALDRLLVSLLAYVVAALVAVAIFLIARETARLLPEDGVSRPAAVEEDRAGRPGARNGDNVTWWLTGAVIVVVAAASAAALSVPVRRRRRGRLGGGARKEKPRAVLALVDETVDDLRVERDPRRAIIAAYARMERGLDAVGIGRRPWEAPLEYVFRVLRELRADSHHIGRLTGLFERAKFSREELPQTAKDDAIQSLLAIRRDIRPPD